MVDSRTNFAKEISSLLRDNYGDKLRVFKTVAFGECVEM